MTAPIGIASLGKIELDERLDFLSIKEGAIHLCVLTDNSL